jgi:hypothetical protein
MCGGVLLYAAQGNPKIDAEIAEKRRFRTGTSPHISPVLLARPVRRRAQRRFRPEGRGVVPESTSNTPKRENTAESGASPAAAERW